MGRRLVVLLGALSLTMLCVGPAVYYYSAVEGLGLITGILAAWPFVTILIVMALVSVRSIVAGKGGIERESHLFIVLITVASIYAFGWPEHVGDFRDKVSKLAVILTLYLLAELAVRLVTHSEFTVKKLEETGDRVTKSMEKSVEDLSNRMDAGAKTVAGEGLRIGEEMKRAVEGVRALNLVATLERMQLLYEDIGRELQIIKASSRVRDQRFSAVMEEGAAGFIEACAEVVRQTTSDAPRREAVLESWVALFKEYLASEARVWKGKRPELATQHRGYLAILSALIDSMCSFAEKDGGIAVFQAVSNVAPLHWYNWRHLDGREYYYEPIDQFRGLVERTIREKKGRVQYGRLTLCLSKGTKPGLNDFESVKKHLNALHLVQTNRGLRLRTAGEWRSDLEYAQLFRGMDKRERVYCIINEADLQHVKKDGMEIKLLKEVFIEELHSEPERAEVGVYTSEDLELLPYGRTDSLMTGYRPKGSEETMWIMAVESSFGTDSAAVALSMTADKEELRDMDRRMTEDRRYGRIRGIRELQ